MYASEIGSSQPVPTLEFLKHEISLQKSSPVTAMPVPVCMVPKRLIGACQQSWSAPLRMYFAVWYYLQI